MARGTIALVGALFLASTLIIIAVSALVLALGVAPQAEGAEKPGLLTLIGMSAMRAMDAGALGGDDGSHGYLFLMV